MYILGWVQFISAGKLAWQPSLYMPTATIALVLPGVVKVVRTHICALGPPNLYMSFILRRIVEVVWRVEPLGGAACGRVVVTALLQGLEWSVTVLCSVLCQGI